MTEQTELSRVPIMLRVGTLVTIMITLAGILMWSIPAMVKVVRWVDEREAFESKILYEIEELRKTRIVGRSSEGWHLNAMIAWSRQLQEECKKKEIPICVPDPELVPWFNPESQRFEER